MFARYRKTLLAAMLGMMVLAMAVSGCWEPPLLTPTPTKPLPPLVQATVTPSQESTGETDATARVLVTPTADVAAVSPLPTPTPTVPAVEPTSRMTAVPLDTRMSSPDFGVQAFLWWRTEIADRDLTLIGEAGFSWVRQTFDWYDIE